VINAFDVAPIRTGGTLDEFTSAEQALTALHPVIQAVPQDDLRRPTPCRDWDVQALAEHLIDTISRLAAAAGIQAAPPNSGPIDQRIRQLTQPILAGWRRRGLAEDVVFAGRTLPAHLSRGIVSLELVVHGWDFAVALRRPLHVSDVHAAHIFGLAQQTLTPASRATAGFDPPVSVPVTAAALDRLIAFTGRDPQQTNWR
jgi:uncharacterized protein (TIGR03086 family)